MISVLTVLQFEKWQLVDVKKMNLKRSHWHEKVKRRGTTIYERHEVIFKVNHEVSRILESPYLIFNFERLAKFLKTEKSESVSSRGGEGRKSRRARSGGGAGLWGRADASGSWPSNLRRLKIENISWELSGKRTEGITFAQTLSPHHGQKLRLI